MSKKPTVVKTYKPSISLKKSKKNEDELSEPEIEETEKTDDDDNNDEVSCDSICSPVGFSRLGNTGVFIYVGAPTLFAKDDINSITLLSFKSYENPAAKISLKS